MLAIATERCVLSSVNLTLAVPQRNEVQKSKGSLDFFSNTKPKKILILYKYFLEGRRSKSFQKNLSLKRAPKE